MAHPDRHDDGRPLHTVGRVLDSRWVMAFAVLAVLVAIAWALTGRGPHLRRADVPQDSTLSAIVELLGVPEGSEVTLDGRKIQNLRFGVSPGTRHALEVTDGNGRSWRQVFVANGSLSLVVELRTYFIEVEVPPSDSKKRDRN